jgi:hypothetical protein
MRPHSISAFPVLVLMIQKACDDRPQNIPLVPNEPHTRGKKPKRQRTHHEEHKVVSIGKRGIYKDIDAREY